MAEGFGPVQRTGTWETEQNLQLRKVEVLPPRAPTPYQYHDVFEADDEEWTERQTVKRRYLSTFEAASLIVNKMIGTGIFSTPGLILFLTQSKTLALTFWMVGGFYAGISLLIYLDYGTGLPFNGAELIYLTRIYHSAKIQMLPPILFASFFVCLYHTAGNSLSFARYVIISSTNPDDGGQYHPNSNLVKAFATGILGLVCFLLWVSPRSGLIMSKTIALYKIMLLIVLGIWGISSRNRHADEGYLPMKDWGYQIPESGIEHNSMQRLSGFVYVIYSYNGWENACYVLGQLDKNNTHWRTKIRWGAVVAVLLVSVAYTFLTLGYYISCTFKDINDQYNIASDLGIARVFSAKAGLSTQGLAINIALSAFGNLLAVAYTQTKVKQAIALHHFLPFSTFFSSDAPFDTPGGALLLHWTMSTIFIIFTPSTTDGYAFLIGLVTYGQMIVASFVGVGRFKLDKAITRAKLHTQGWRPWISSNTINYGSGFALAIINVIFLVAAAWPIPEERDGIAKHRIHRWLWPAILGSCATFGLFYWSVLRLLMGRLGNIVGWKWRISSGEGESDYDQMRRMTRRDGTEHRYQNEVVEGGFADRVRKGCNQTLRFLGNNL